MVYVMYHIVISLTLAFTNFVLHCQCSPTIYETLTGQNIGNCNLDENGFKVHSIVEFLLFCKLEQGKNALIENGTQCFCASCNSTASDVILKKDSERNSSSLAFYKELVADKILQKKGKIYIS